MLPDSLRLSVRANRELNQHTTWYAEQSARAANRFLDALESRFLLIAENPELYAVIRRDVRKSVLQKFPITIYYRIDGAEIFILSIHHQAKADIRI